MIATATTARTTYFVFVIFLVVPLQTLEDLSYPTRVPVLALKIDKMNYAKGINHLGAISRMDQSIFLPNFDIKIVCVW